MKDKIENLEMMQMQHQTITWVLGYVSVGYAWLKVLGVCYKEYSSNKDFYEDKIQTASFYFNRVLPRIDSHYLSATTGSRYIMDFKFN